MTDNDAKAIVEILLAACPHPNCTQCHYLRHSLQAIEDRAALVDKLVRFKREGWPVGETALDAARRHIRGES